MQITRSPMQISMMNDALSGDFNLPATVHGVVLFAHGSGSSRLSPRNQYVARELNEAGLATLLIDLLSTREEELESYTRHLRFDIPLLAGRLAMAIEWLRNSPETQSLPIGLFGASTGSAAAIIAATQSRHPIAAVVSRGGRPDLAGQYLAALEAPTLLIVGGADHQVIDLTKEAMNRMHCQPVLEIVPGASHLFEETGALEQVARLAKQWFLQFMQPVTRSSSEHAPVT